MAKWKPEDYDNHLRAGHNFAGGLMAYERLHPETKADRQEYENAAARVSSWSRAFNMVNGGQATKARLAYRRQYWKDLKAKDAAAAAAKDKKDAEAKAAGAKKVKAIQPKGEAPKADQPKGPAPVGNGQAQAAPPKKTAVEQAVENYQTKNGQAPTLGFRRKQGKLQNDMTTVNGMGLDMSKSGERDIRANAARTIRTQQTWAYNDMVEERNRTQEQKRLARINAAYERGQQKVDDRNYANRRFSSQRGWDNLGRVREGDAKAIQGYGRDHDQYKQSWGQLEARMKQLGEYYDKVGGVGLGGKGKEFAQVRDLIQKTHERGGLSQAQMEAALDKMDSYRQGILSTADAGAAVTARMARQEAARNRKSLGILAEGLTDEQVAGEIAKQRHGRVGEALGAIAALKREHEPRQQADLDDDTRTPGVEDYTKHIGTLLDNGYSMADMYRAAMRDKDASAKFRAAAQQMKQNGSSDEAIQEAIGLQFLQQTYDANKGDLTNLDKAVKAINTVGGGPNENAHEALRKWNEPAPAAPAVPPAAQPPAPTAPQPIAPKAQPPAPTAAPAPIEPAPAGSDAPVTTPTPEPPAPAEQKKPGLAILTR